MHFGFARKIFRSLRRRGAGQSMMEAIIACGIITTAVASSLTLVQASISAEKESELSIVATNLAREGVEIVRAKRDSNWLSGAAWDLGLEGPSYDHTAIPVFSSENNAWTLDFSPNSITDASGRVYRYVTGSGNAVVGLMVQAVEQPTDVIGSPFSRLVTIDSICDNSGLIETVESGTGCAGSKIGLRVRSAVMYKNGGRTRNIEVEESLYNWR